MAMAAAASKQGIILGRLWKALLLSRSKRLKENKKLMKIGLDVGTRQILEYRVPTSFFPSSTSTKTYFPPNTRYQSHFFSP